MLMYAHIRNFEVMESKVNNGITFVYYGFMDTYRVTVPVNPPFTTLSDPYYNRLIDVPGEIYAFNILVYAAPRNSSKVKVKLH